MKNKREIGYKYEEIVVSYAVKSGFKIIERNYRTKFSEIDIIINDNNTIVFVEVKYRKINSFYEAVYSVSKAKQKRISKGALYYIMSNNLSLDNKYRFDVVAIDGKKLKWIKNAFDFYKGNNL